MDNCKIVCLIIVVFIVGSDSPLKAEAYRYYTINNIRNALAFENESVPLECSSHIPLKYCRFVHERDAIHIYVREHENRCQIRILATNTTAGMWRCYPGRTKNGVEVVKVTKLRIVREITATARNVTAIQGKPATLLCVTKNVKTLRYCRFEPPNSKPFSINSNAKPNKPLLDRYYFPQDKSLKQGECAVTITKADLSDIGTWTCSAGFEDGREYNDSITVTVTDRVIIKRWKVLGKILRVAIELTFTAAIGLIFWILLCNRQRERNVPGIIIIQVSQEEEQPPNDNPSVVVDEAASSSDPTES